jgi:DNA repair photolyase
MATLYKEVDGNLIVKDGGARSESIKWKDNGRIDKIVSHRPTVGCSILVGSLNTRTYGSDYWLTTEVLEILEETEDRVRFRTKNSIYVWEK